MSRQVRHRVTAIVLGGFLLGAAIVTTGTANAEQAGEAGRSVVFEGGGIMGLSCKSTPSVGSMTVPAESTVRVVNRTGHGANLMLNGESQGSIEDDGATEVVFRRGTTAVLLDPSCAINDQATPVLVTATPSTSPTAPAPGPSASTSSPVPPSGSGSVPPASGGSAQPGTGSPSATTRPTTGAPGPIIARPDVTRPAGNGQGGAQPGTVPGSMPQGGHVTRTKTTTARSAAGHEAPTLSGLPLGGGEGALDGVPAKDVTTPAEPALEAEPTAEAAAAEPVAAMRPMSGPRPVGLLAIVAVVMVCGVTVGAIRAIVSQRASRASLA
ncbi:hypothetical protein [Actinoplanes sp. NPDC051859]|uniref:hypothetical protein n=1 Tax=Actinoplanes sp. NPDC051859 TaxID=3363909 RepID=UPI0037BBAF73